MTRRILSIRNSLANVAYTVARSFKVKVVFGGGASTDGKTIMVPELPLNIERNLPAPYTSVGQAVQVVKGVIVHEGEHCNSTDFEHPEASEALREGGLLGALVNHIEDTRIERRSGQRFLGAGRILAEAVSAMVEIGMVKFDPKGPADVFATFVGSWGRYHVNEQHAMKATLEAAETKVEELLGKPGLARLKAYLSTHYRKLASTADSWAMTEGIHRLLIEIAEEEEQKKQDPSQQGSAQGGAGNGSSQSGGNQASSKDDGTDPVRDGSQASPGGDGAGAKNGAGGRRNVGDKPAGDDVSDGVQGPGAGSGSGASQILDDASNATTGPLVDFSQALEALGSSRAVSAPPRVDPPMLSEEAKAAYDEVRSSISSDAAVLSSRIVNYLLAKRESDKWNTTSGKIDRKKLAGLAVGNPRVFYRKSESNEVNTAISIVIDSSGSMTATRRSSAQKLMVLLGEATKQLDIALEIIGFTSGDPGVFMIKPFEKSYRQSVGRIGGYGQLSGGGTELGNALMQAAYRLAEREEPRKLLIAITDGETDDEELTSQAVELISHSGIELLAFGIETSAVAAFFPRHKVIYDPQELGLEVLQTLRGNLVQAA